MEMKSASTNDSPYPNKEANTEDHVDLPHSRHPLIEHKKIVDCEDAEEAGSSDMSDDHEPESVCCQKINLVQTTLSKRVKEHWSVIRLVLIVVLAIAFAGYLIAACIINLKRAIPLLVISGLVIAYLLYTVLWWKISKPCMRAYHRVVEKLKPKASVIKWVAVLLVIVVTAVVVGARVKQYRGLLGIAVFILVLFLTSNNPSKVRWRPVLWGMLLNFIFAILILKTSAGITVFQWMATQVTTFLGFTNSGSAFVFGKDTFKAHYFAFVILPTIVFFSCVISLLYYIGVMQAIIQKIAFVMQITMGTSATESLSCAGNIFVGQTEAPILVRPFLPTMTLSELHAVMAGGFATIAGGVLAAFIGMGIDPVHLICASVMNAPMALALSKLSYPETENKGSRMKSKLEFAKPSEQNFIEAAAAGASQSIGLVANIAANLIAFLALLAFVNAMLSWFGSMVDCPQLSFELICSYVFWIVSYIMGVDSKDCLNVAELIGTKLVINEFLAYEKLSDFITNRETCTLPYISKKSEIIATYALCGFANLSSVGVQLGGIGAMAPSRRADLAKVVIRALLVGTVATLMTATLAGVLITDYNDMDPCSLGNNTLPFNSAANVTIAVTNSTAVP